MPIELKINDDVAEITLSGPNGNKLDSLGIKQFARALEELADSGGLRFVILSGQGRTFCHGRLPTPGLRTETSIRADLEPVLEITSALDRLGAVVVAAVEGSALGFGFGLAIQADHTVVADGARLALTEMSHGIPPLLVMSYLTHYVPYKTAFDLAASCREMAPAEALSLGLVNDIAEPGSALTVARAWIEHARQVPTAGLVLLRQFTRARAGLSDRQAMELGASQIAAHLAAHRLVK